MCAYSTTFLLLNNRNKPVSGHWMIWLSRNLQSIRGIIVDKHEAVLEGIENVDRCNRKYLNRRSIIYSPRFSLFVSEVMITGWLIHNL
jgi:hypothetical protein